MENNKGDARLQRLTNSDYEIVEGQPDIRDWDVKDSQNRTIGKVDELIFDPQSRKVKYMVVDLDDNDFDFEERNVLVPIGLAELHEKDDDVIISSVSAQDLNKLPTYEKDQINPQIEEQIRMALPGMEKSNSQNYYQHEYFEEENLQKRRQQKTGSTSLPIIRERFDVTKQERQAGEGGIGTRREEKFAEENVNLDEARDKVETERFAEANLSTEQEELEYDESEIPVGNKQPRDEAPQEAFRNTERNFDKNQRNIDNENERR